MPPGQTISQVARRTGFTPATLRYYEELELVRPARSPTGYRHYSAADVELLEFIAGAKRLGLSLDQIRPLAAGWRGSDCRSTRQRLTASIEARLGEVRRLIADLDAFRTELEAVHRQLTDGSAAGRCGPGCGCEVDVRSGDPLTGHAIEIISLHPRDRAPRTAPIGREPGDARVGNRMPD